MAGNFHLNDILSYLLGYFLNKSSSLFREGGETITTEHLDNMAISIGTGIAKGGVVYAAGAVVAAAAAVGIGPAIAAGVTVGVAAYFRKQTN